MRRFQLNLLYESKGEPVKILFIGSTERNALALHYFTNFVQLGHLVLPYYPDYFRTKYFFQRVKVYFNRTPLKKRVEVVANELVSLCRGTPFDLVFVIAENFLSSETIEEMRKVSKKPVKFLFHSHDNLFSSGIFKPVFFEKNLKTYDFVFTTKSQNVDRYKQVGVENIHYLPSAFDPPFLSLFPAAESSLGETLPISFVGTYSASRIPYLEAIGWDKLFVYGERWPFYPGFLKNRKHIRPAVYHFQFSDVTPNSLVSLGLLREEASDRHTTRTFEIPACGSLQIAPRNTEIASFFEEDKEIILFNSPEELKDKSNYYLTHDFQRKRIAEKGYERCLRDKHTYRDRIESMLSIMEK